MTHYVFFKFQPGYLTDDQFAQLAERFQKVTGAVNGLSELSVKRTIVDKETGMDMMVTFKAESIGRLTEYQAHPLHLKIVEDTNPYTVRKFSFDCD